MENSNGNKGRVQACVTHAATKGENSAVKCDFPEHVRLHKLGHAEYVYYFEVKSGMQRCGA